MPGTNTRIPLMTGTHTLVPLILDTNPPVPLTHTLVPLTHTLVLLTYTLVPLTHTLYPHAFNSYLNWQIWALGSNVPNFSLLGHDKGINAVDFYYVCTTSAIQTYSYLIRHTPRTSPSPLILYHTYPGNSLYHTYPPPHREAISPI